MLYCITMKVNLPRDLSPEDVRQLIDREKAHAVELQEQGKIVHLWRVAGRFANITIYDAESNDELHDLLSSLPMFRYLEIEVVPLAKHPSSIK